MKIHASTIHMDSARIYSQSREQTQTINSQDTRSSTTYGSSVSFIQTYSEQQKSSASSHYSRTNNSFDHINNASDESTALTSDLYTNISGKNISIINPKDALRDFRREFIERLEEFMERIRKQLLGHGNYISKYLSKESNSLALQFSSMNYIVDLTTNPVTPGSIWNIQTTNTLRKKEFESTTFQTTGTVQTNDGRNIDFHISLEMSRAFIEESSTLSESTQYILTDPLVIQLENAPNTISDETWLFDIDGDGTDEELSQLASGNAFLAIDQNENGIIDDGSELFGTRTGNGFQELSAYDEDGNGWIDENDAIYTKLKIWTKTANGQDQLLDLQAGDIGAIYLGFADTTFSHKTQALNETRAVVRQTGFYLHESTGDAGTIQQIDFATKSSFSN